MIERGEYLRLPVNPDDPVIGKAVRQDLSATSIELRVASPIHRPHSAPPTSVVIQMPIRAPDRGPRSRL